MRAEKQLMVREMKENFGDSGALVLTDPVKVDVEKLCSLRKALSEVSAGYMVVKNRLLKRVLEESKGIKDLSITGSTAVASSEDPVSLAKVIAEFSKKNNGPEIKEGILGNQIVSPDKIRELAKLPPREVLLATVVGRIASPLSGLVGVLNARLTSVLYVLNGIIEKKQRT
ncbi:MAG: 50S ribosomal protein L10 [Candidatus Theseobacter exili]|nr:50S ribosomal protein L10 [Candidatus Theseobacter exili]